MSSGPANWLPSGRKPESDKLHSGVRVEGVTMNGKSFPNMALNAMPTASLPLASSDPHGPTSYSPLASENPTHYQRGAYQHPQSQYPAGSGFHGSSSLQVGPSAGSMSSLGGVQSNMYQDFNQRTFLGETMRDNIGYNSVSNTFDSPNVASTSSNPSPVYDLEYSPSPVGDHPPRTSHLRYPVSRPASQQGNRLTQKPADAGLQTLPLLPPSGFYPSTLPHPMTYSNHGQSTDAESPATQLSRHVLGSFSHDHQSVENSPPVGATSFQTLATSGGRLAASGSRMVPGSSSHSMPHSSIPMRKASSEWMTQSSYLPVPKHGIGVSQKRYTSPAVAPGAHLQDAYLGAEARASDLPPRDAESYMDHSVKRLASPSVSSHPQTSSHSASPAPLEGRSFQGPPPKKKKKSKMHTCEICDKKFPRPSGLKTHMNTHNNARPYPCGFPGCNRTFGVRSNAKRHLRTHGVIPAPPGESSADAYVVGFSTPVVAPPPDRELDHEEAGDENQRTSKVPFKLRWMPPSLTNRTNTASLKSVSETGEFSDEEGEDDEEDELRSGWEPSRSLSDVSVPRLSHSSSSSVTGSPDCSCTVPCGSSPCLSLITAPMPHPHPPSLQTIDAFAGPTPGRVKDEHGHASLQVDRLPSL